MYHNDVFSFAQYVKEVYMFSTKFLNCFSNPENANKDALTYIHLANLTLPANSELFKLLYKINTKFDSKYDSYYSQYVYHDESYLTAESHTKTLCLGFNNEQIYDYWYRLFLNLHINSDYIHFSKNMKKATKNIKNLYLNNQNNKSSNDDKVVIRQKKWQYLKEMHEFINNLNDNLSNHVAFKSNNGIFLAIDNAYHSLKYECMDLNVDSLLVKSLKKLIDCYYTLHFKRSHTNELKYNYANKLCCGFDFSNIPIVKAYWIALLHFLNTNGTESQNLHDARMIFNYNYICNIKKHLRKHD